MSITRVTRINLTGDVSVDDHTYVHTFEVEVSSRDDQQASVLGAAGIPNLGAPHPSDPAAVVTSKRVRLREERRWKLWTVDVNYAIVAGTEDTITRDPTQAPDLRVPELRIRSAQREEAFTLDVDLKPITNTAGELYPQHMRTATVYYAIISYRRWFRGVDLDPYNAVLNWCGRFNENAWFTASARSIQIQGLTFEREFFQNQLFFRTDFELAGPVSPSLVLPNEGMHVKTGFNVDGVIGRKPILLKETDDSGNPTGLKYRVSEPVPISADGKTQLADGQPPLLNTFRMFYDVDFADIGL
jgi:hypothetical protein